MPEVPRRRPRRIVAGLLCAVMIGAAGTTGSVRADEAAYNLAVGLYQQERWEQAAERFAEFVQESPNDAKVPTATLYRGLALVNARQFDEARAVLRGFVRNHPKSPELPDALYRVAEASYLLDDLKSAETEFQAFLGKYPDHKLGEWTLPYLGDVQLRLGKAGEAARTFRKSLDQYPDGRMAEDSRFGLARALQTLGQQTEAVEQYRKLASDPQSPFAPQAQMNIGVAHFDAAKYPEAAEAFEQVVERFPKSEQAAAARLNAGYAWYKVGDYRKAIDKFTQAAQAPEQAATAGYWLGISYKGLGDYAQAAAALRSTFEKHPDSPLAENVLYQWADSELLGGRYASAADRFLEVVRRWPKSELADDSLHFAAEAALLEAGRLPDRAAQAAQLKQAGELLTRFEREYSRSDLQLPHALLEGRLLEARGTAADREKAIALFRRVMAESTIPRTQSQARFHLARALQKGDDHAQAVEVFVPLLEEVRRTGATSEFLPALVLAGQSLMQLKKYDRAAQALTQFLELRPDGDQADQALALRAVAHARGGDKTKARLDLQSLADQFAGSPLRAEKLHELAELAYDAGDYTWAAELFDQLVKLGPQSDRHAAALSGAAWSQYQLKNFDAAAAGFERFAKEFSTGNDRLAEAMYMRGQALQDAGRPKEAVPAFEAVLTKFAPPQPAATGAEQQPPLKFAYLAGLQLARAHKELDDIEAADATYRKLMEHFPRPAHADHLLDEWALLHYEAENYQKADEIFARLVKEYPTSDRSDDARLNLAESDFIAGRLDAAARTFRTLVANEKAGTRIRERALYQLIELESERQNWPEVVKRAAEVRQRFPESKYRDDVLFRLAEAQLALGQSTEAEALLKNLQSKHRDPAAADAPRWAPRLWVLLAEAQLRQKKYDEAAATVTELEQKAPKSPALHLAYEVLGRSYKNRPLPDFEQARAAFQKVIDDPRAQGSETAAKAQLMIAETLYLQKKFAEAQEAYLKVYHLYDYPDWQAPALLQVAACDEQLQQWQQAVKSYEELLQKFPTSDAADTARDRLKAARQKASG